MEQLVLMRERGRFADPRPSERTVTRPRLEQRLSDVAGRVVTITAPGGYGKTTLASSFLRNDWREARWLTIERVDNDPIVLMSAVVQALAGLVDLTTPANESDVIAPTFAELVESVPVPFVLVIDDVHELVDPSGARVLATVAQHLGARSTMILVGREFSDDATLAAIRLDPGTVEVGVDDLAFDPAEAAAMLELLGADTDPTAVAALTERFEGWPAGLALAVIGAAGPAPARPPSERGQLDDHVYDYLATEWVGRLDPVQREVLMEVACLGPFTVDMCDDVLGRDGVRSVLRSLRRQQIVVATLDDRGEWFRLHPLMAEWLCSELKSDDRKRWEEVHRAASDWWECHGDIDLAIEFAHTTGDLARCENLVSEHGGRYASRGLHATVGRWLDMLGEQRVRASADLCAIAAIGAMDRLDGNRALNWTRALAGTLAFRSAAVDDPARLKSDVLTAALEPRPSDELIEIAAGPWRHFPAGPWRGLACWVLGGLYLLRGDDRATAILEEGLFEAEVADATRMHAHLNAVLALDRELDGDHEAAAELGQKAYAELRRFGFEVTASSAQVLAVQCLLEARAGRRSAATALADQVRTLLSAIDPVAPWLQVTTRIPLLDAYLLLDNPEQGRVTASEIERHLGIEHATSPARGVLGDRVTRLAAAETVAAERTWSLTAAELNVLQYLPTNLSLSDIADRLYVSRNTVKTHAAAIYRKLGTTSRGATVDLARDAGLLSGSGQSEPAGP